MGFLLEEDFALKRCPLTGLLTKGRVTLETAHGGYIIYKFKPIGSACFEHESLKSLASLFADGSFQPLTAWAGLCRAAYELEQKSPIIQGEPEDEQSAIPDTFEDKQHHFLRLFYEAGGKEHRSRDIFLNDDFPMAFAQNAEEFFRIFDALVDDGLLRHDKNCITADVVDGRRAHFRSVLLTPLGKQQVQRLLAAPVTGEALLSENKDGATDFDARTHQLLNYIHQKDAHRVPDLLPIRDYAVGQASNANEFEMVVDYAESRGWLSFGKKAVISLGRIHYRDVKLTLSGIEQVKSSTVMFESIANCPLTGLPLRGRAKFEPLNGSAEVLYTFKPIGSAIFKRDDLLGVLKVTAGDNYTANTDLAAVCREAQERGQPPVYLTSKMLYDFTGDFLKSFEEKQVHFLRLLYETGGNEYKEKDISIEDDFTLAFAKNSEEFTRILKRLIAKRLIEYVKPNDTPNDWPGGIRLYYNSVLLTSAGEKEVIQLLGSMSSTPSVPTPTPTDMPEKIFISHSSDDAGIVEEVIDLLEHIGVRQEQIFCSSIKGYGIALGDDFLQRLKDELNSNVLVLFILTPNFYASRVCLCEMGATWVKTNLHIPILVPPLEFKDVREVIPLTQGFKIEDALEWNQLKEQLEKWFKMDSRLTASAWERKRNKSIQVITSKIQPPTPSPRRATVRNFNQKKSKP